VVIIFTKKSACFERGVGKAEVERMLHRKSIHGLLRNLHDADELVYVDGHGGFPLVLM
jgi:hypothetical protein